MRNPWSLMMLPIGDLCPEHLNLAGVTAKLGPPKTLGSAGNKQLKSCATFFHKGST